MTGASKSAQLFRMKTAEHVCPFGIRAKDLLKRKGYEIHDHLLENREQQEEFKEKHQVQTTPQIFIDGNRIGGYTDLRKFFGLAVPNKDAKTYTPIVAIFSVGAAMALAFSWAMFGTLFNIRTVEWFIAISMCLLGVQKLRDLDAFVNGFLGYDMLAQQSVRYAYAYPFIETGAGILMIAGAFIWLAAPLAFLVGTIGALSVYKAVYVEKRDIKCACVGGNSNVPLVFISLTENIMMVLMALWMAITYVVIS